MLDRGSIFVSAFWDGLQRVMDTRLAFNMAYHPRTDGQTKRTNQIIEDILRACCMDYKANWSELVPLMEFAYNNSY